MCINSYNCVDWKYAGELEIHTFTIGIFICIIRNKDMLGFTSIGYTKYALNFYNNRNGIFGVDWSVIKKFAVNSTYWNWRYTKSYCKLSLNSLIFIFSILYFSHIL